MLKKFILLLLAVLLLSSCASANPYELTFNPDGSDEMSLLYSDGNFEVYSMGGLMMCTVDDEPMMLEMALKEGIIYSGDLVKSAEEDTTNEKMTATAYMDEGTEYHYETFNLIVPESQDGKTRIYFTSADVTFRNLFQ